MVGGELNRKQGAIEIDEAIIGLGRALPWNDPAASLTVPAGLGLNPTQTVPVDVNFAGAPFLKTGKVYQNGDFRGDVAGSVAGPTAGAHPLGWDSVVDDKDINYCCRQARIGDWANIDDAVYIDLSCDMDGDVDVDGDDVSELVNAILGTVAGDVDLDGDRDAADKAIIDASIAGPNPCIAAGTCGWADGDMNCDQTVDDNDYAPFVELFTMVAGDNGTVTRSLAIDFGPPSTATGSLIQAALEVTMIDLQNPQPPGPFPAPNFGAFEAGTCTAVGEAAGCARWVGPPHTYLESLDVPGSGNYRAARLQCSPFYYDWSQEEVLYIYGAEIVPSSAYEVLAYDSACKGAESGCTFTFPSSPLVLVTRRHGDIATPFEDGVLPLTQPNALDVAAAVNKFKSLPGAPPKAVAQNQPNLPDLNGDLNAIDIGIVVDAVKQFAYPFSGPCVCPSSVTCNSTMCSTAGQCTGPHGAGSTCVKTCSAGPRTGAICANNKHCGVCAAPATNAGAPCTGGADCPGGTCTTGTCNTQGFCRDRCSRCN